jgi:hypothetical protein
MPNSVCCGRGGTVGNFNLPIQQSTSTEESAGLGETIPAFRGSFRRVKLVLGHRHVVEPNKT